ncbi:SMI1/KNR4 family protein [Thiobacillus sp.]|uniref:SMI1/KNR4 family protein n=1 Tax=Thiobacillus sp. TaxID=924 RepID=UPI001ACFEDFC|nr:SMI1/KNR4 family protein [Thiobacillus sp.]MBN8781337.1 SMI1/KNR4 family protein [Thiobacillus sp.]
MIDSDFNLLAGQLTLRAPAEASVIAQFRIDHGVELPEDYVDFLLHSNGADGPVGETGYVSLWAIDELSELNRGYRVEEFAPGLLLFGSDGGDEAFAFDLRDSSMPIVEVPFIGVSLDEARPLAATFTEMLTSTWAR